MARSSFNSRELRKLIQEVKQPLLLEKAEEAKAAAEAAAPIESGEYASKFEVRQLKFATFVVNTAKYANVIEFGARGGDNPRFRPLGRAIDAIQEAE